MDTRSTYTWIPGDLLARVGVTPEEERPFELADGRKVRYGMGWVQITLAGREQPTILVCAPPGREPLLGVVTLEEFGLAADPVNERLIPVPGLAKVVESPAPEKSVPPRTICPPQTTVNIET